MHTITRLPSLKLFTPDGSIYDYNGDRSLEHLTTWTLNTVSEVPDEKARIVQLSLATFDQTIKKGHWVVEFYSDICSFSSRFAPVYAQVARELKHMASFAKADVLDNPLLAKRFGITPHGDYLIPHVKYIINGKTCYTFRGNQTYEDLSEFVNGGFTAEPPERIPLAILPPAPTDELVEAFDIIKKFIDEHVWATVFATFVYGIILGKFILGARSPKQKQRPQPQWLLKRESKPESQPAAETQKKQQ